jgi:hypothetical protein
MTAFVCRMFSHSAWRTLREWEKYLSADVETSPQAQDVCAKAAPSKAEYQWAISMLCRSENLVATSRSLYLHVCHARQVAMAQSLFW